MAKINKMRKGRVYRGAMTKMALKSSRRSQGQKSWVPEVVKASNSGWVNRPQKKSRDHSFQRAGERRSILETNQPKSGAKARENTMEWVKPRWISRAETVSTKWPAKVSRSGMVPAIAP